MANLNLNVSPYFDDFDPDKDFLRVLFRPGFPVQARELTTLQTFMTNQVERFGNHIFKNGARVSEGTINVLNGSHYMFLTGAGNAGLPLGNARAGTAIADLNTLEGKIITNSDGTVRARVIKQPTGSVGTANVGALYFQYITAKVFAPTGDYIYANLADNPGLTVELVNTFNALSPSCLGEIAEGVYYVNGFFTRVPAQTVVISTTSQTPTAKLGFRAEQAVTTQNNDSTLYDNARGTTNEGAPGSHRLKQTLSFVALPIDSTEDETFFRALTIENGVIVNQTKGNAQYSTLGDTLARRTYDESGNYAVKPFTVTVTDGDSDNYKLKLGPAKAYVRGYEITKNNPQIITYGKNTDFKRTSNFSVPFNKISNFLVLSYSGTLPGQTGSDPYTYANRLLLKDSDGDTIGVARAYGFFNDSLYIYDTKMFQVITTSSSLTISDGNDLSAGKAVGYAYNADGQAGATGNAITLINWSARLPRAQEVSSTVATISSGITIDKSQVYELDDVVTITGAGGFTASVQELSLLNPNPSLVNTLSNEVKTLRGTSTVFDNDFTIIEDTGLSSGNMNGYWNASRVDDQEEIEKVLKFKYLKIKNTGSTARTGVNFGWSAQDKLLSLAYPDVLQVYGVNQSTDNSFAAGQFSRIEINTTGLVPVGSTIKGLSSGTEAIVALQNATATGAGDIASTPGYHSFLTGTGSNTTLEIIYQKNTTFRSGEVLKVTTPNSISAFTSPITYVSATDATGRNISALYNLDNGQRNEFYDIGRLTRVGKRKAPPIGDIIVFYSYFTASPINNFYYSVDSYRNLNYYKDDVRLFSEPQPIGTNINNEGRDLRNSIDFRFRVQDIVTDITSSPFLFSSRNYYNQPRIQPDTVFTTDMEQYLGNVTLLSIDTKGSYISKKGQPSVKNFKRPEITPESMPVAYITIPGGVRYPETEIEVEIIDNKRYTMRDIGKIENRINRLEESVALSLLESQALHDNISERAKSGFVVDDFSLAQNNPNSSADDKHPEYNASIDVIDNILIPGQTDGVPISMIVSSKDNINEHYFNERGIVIKDFKEEELVSMTQATGCHRINPFATWIYIGDLILTPNEHHWRDKVNSYFTEFNGKVRPFSGDSDQFSQFLRVTTSSPGGSSTSRREWFGAQSSTQRFNRNPGVGTSVTTTVRQARRRITTTTFGAPRIIAGTKPTETHTGSEVIENLQDYWMRNPAGGIKFEAANLKANTEHKLTMGEIEIGSPLTTDVSGMLSGSFNIPYQTFKAGEEIVSLKDTTLGGKASSASAVFKSVGHRDFFDIVARTSNKRVDTLNLGTQVRSQTTVNIPPPEPPGDRGGDGDGGSGDPIAQLFKLPTKGNPTAAQVLSGEVGGTIPNAILTSLDLWICYIDERPAMNTLRCEIRETVNGYPGGPSNVIGTTGWVVLDKSMEVSVPSTTNGTNFKFREPVVLKGDTEYAIVLKTPSDATEVFVAEIGKQLLDGSGVHDEQPNVGGYFGSFFVSQNQTTWSAEQNFDMTFRLNRANFDINDTGTPPPSSITFKNELTNLKTYKADIGAFNRGLAIETFEYSNYVRILHPNHGMNHNNAQVRLMGFDKFGSPNNYNGIPDSELNGVHDVMFATIDSYFVKTTTKATSTGTPPVPIFETFATQPVVFDSLVQRVPFFKTEEEDEVKVFINSASTNSLNLAVDSNKIKNDSLANVTPGVEVEIPANEYLELEEPHIVRNLLNSNGNDLITRVTLDSFSEYSSPIFNNDDTLYPVVFRNLTGTLLNDSDIEGLTTRIIDTNSTDNTLQEYASYLSAVQSELEFSAYCTKQIDLEIPADGFTIKFDADMEPSSKLEFSYKVRAKGDQTPFEDISWEDFKASEFITESNNGPFTSDTDIKEYTVNANVPFEFNSFKIRIRMLTKNEAQIPRIKDLRIIADI